MQVILEVPMPILFQYLRKQFVPLCFGDHIFLPGTTVLAYH